MRIFTTANMVMVLLLISTITFSQNIHWNNEPNKGFVFQITNKEAQKLLTLSGSDSIVSKMLHTQVDTFDVRRGWINRPSKGHFILAKIVGNQVFCEYTSVFPYQVFLLKEYNALSLQILDMEGNVRSDAKVKFKFRKIRFDDESKTYRLENAWFYGNDKVVTVDLDGFRSVFNIQRHAAPTWYGNYYDRQGPSFYSYMITDKNKYKPTEKVRFKSFALSQSRSPLHRDLQLWLSYTEDKTWRTIQKKLGVVSPHRPGSFVGEFQLHDSLKLKLDQSYTLQLRDKSGRIVSHSNFRYEDYELTGNNLEIRLSGTEQFHPENNELTIIATDVNGLMLKDGRATVVVRTKDIHEIFQPMVTLKDTLLMKQINLDPNTATTVNIPSSIFQKTNTAYEVQVVVLNNENQRMEKSLQAVHSYSQYELRASLISDSIVYELLSNGKQVPKVSAKIRYNEEKVDRDIVLPLREKLNATISVVELKTDNVSRTIQMNTLLPQMDVRGGIRNDSLRLSLYNPHKLETSWYIYKGSDLVVKGFGTEMTYDSLVRDHLQTYYVELLYSFGGQEQIKRRSFEFRDGFLDVALNIPDRAFPGQTVDALIEVNNQSGEPVSNVDLTALAVTSKLHYNLPDLPFYGNQSSSRPQSDTYSKNDINKRLAKLKLDYRKWETKAGLDTMMYYRFTYPMNGMFKRTTSISDSTQFAPYVMRSGAAELIYVIEIDRVPVYFSWADQPEKYSFYVPEKRKCNVTLRLQDRVLIFDSLAFEKGKKTIFSVDLDHLPSDVKTIKIDLPEKQYKGQQVYPSFTPVEMRRYAQYIAWFKPQWGRSYLEQGRRMTPLFTYLRNDRTLLVGPIMPGMQTFNAPESSKKTTYQHTGGFMYDFEDNIVYKLEAKNFMPDRLLRAPYDPLINVNDVVMTPKVFMKEYIPDERWHTRVIDVVDQRLRLKVLLPNEKASSGFASFLFENVETGQVISPCQLKTKQSEYFNVPRGLQNIIAIYNNGTYLKKDSVDLRSYTQVVIDLNEAELHPSDPKSGNWIRTAGTNCFGGERKFTPISTRSLGGYGGSIRGIVYAADDNSPLPGVNVVLKGTTIGTVTNSDGEFEIEADQMDVTLVFSFIGLTTQEINVRSGSDVTIMMQYDIMQLSEVVVTGYGIQTRHEAFSVTVRDDQTPQPQPDVIVEEKREAEEQLYRELLNLKTIRTNFSDVGFWEPKLFTDKKGQAKFTVTYPDDITQWNAIVYGMNRNLQTGTTRKNIKSYKPIMAQLAVPNFLTIGDSSVFTGKVLNYSDSKSITGKIKWSRGDANSEKNVSFNDLQTDAYGVKVSNADSVKVSYSFTRDDGYLDGEERKVPVVEQGVERADGTLQTLNSNDPVKIKAASNETITVEMMSSPLDIYANEASYLLNYRYDCNEQLASKLIGFINYKKLAQYEGKEFKYDKDVKRIIDRLLKNQNEEFLWSWWDVSEHTSYWMSVHILRALKLAADAGYAVDLDVANVGRKAEYRFEIKREYTLWDIELLNVLIEWGIDLKYAKHVAHLDSMIWKDENMGHRQYSRLKERLLLQEIRQMKKISFKPDSVLKYKRDGILGEVHFSDGRSSTYWYNDELTVNTIAYRIAKRDSLMKSLTGGMQLYFMNQRNRRSWNTYESSSVLTTILPDLLETGATRKNPSLVKLSGKANTSINKFPYTITLNPGEELMVNKESGLAVYLMSYKKERVVKAKTGVDGFDIKTSLGNNTGLLEAGKPVTMKVEVNVKKDADLEYVMLEIPIPGSCSYVDKDKNQNRNPYETHREYFKERTVIFCERMKSGKYTFEVSLLPRFTGKYFINPSQVSLMYVPVVNANTDMKNVVVR